ncbi:cysteine synthase CysM [Deinococcus fonticola]|uniref:cysteine synthase CysM n=1 Tax=Deinococcus fonticola TaxID=2528713 RepID=UPI001074B7B4|nr:cysteine synthase CysM [Deinococcus fonticola]
MAPSPSLHAAQQVTDLIGRTPLVRLNTLSRPGVDIYAKLEGQNPGGSVKDRAARRMIEGALERGDLPPGKRIIEATSGNTGIALAMIARQKGLQLELVMPENATAERVGTMRAYGATVTLTPTAGGMEGAIDYAREQVEKGEAWMLNQFGNPDNPQAHYETTGPELWADTAGQITHFVSSMGTTGTIMGTSRYLKEQNPDVRIVGVQPTEGSSIPGIRRWPKEYLPTIFEPQRVDRIVDISEDEARAMTRRLARDEAVFGGMSSGGAVAAAVKVAAELESGLLVCIICDRGDRYLSSDLFTKDD